eukprot:g213.t1
MLPQYRTYENQIDSTFGGTSSIVPEYVVRMLSYRQMDLEYTLSQMIQILHAPRNVYKMASCRKQTKGQWARDDPAFVVILMILFFVTSIAFAIELGDGGFASYIVAILYGQMYLFIPGIVIAFAGRWVGNTLLRDTSRNTYDKVEFLYALDIHFNACVPLYLVLCVLQFLLLPFLLQKTFLAALAANAIYAFAAVVYWYITFLGYTSIAFLHHTEAYLYPMFVVLLYCTVATVLGSNTTRLVMGLLFRIP